MKPWYGDTYEYLAIFKSQKQPYLIHKAHKTTKTKYLNKFKTSVQVIKQHGYFFKNPRTSKKHYPGLGYGNDWLALNIYMAKAENNVQKEYTEMDLLYKSDNMRYAKVIYELENDFTKRDEILPSYQHRR